MFLALDAGNTNVTIGVFDGARLAYTWRLRTVREQTADEWGILLRNLFALDGIELARIDGVIISSVVPPVNSRLSEMSERYFGREPLFVTSDTDVGMPILYDNPSEVGADRIVNAVAALHKYGRPCVVVDLGTAITFDCVSAAGEYLGGIICPGIGISIEALFTRTARLPLVDFRKPDKLIGTTPQGSVLSGLYFGAVGMIDGILERLTAALGAGTTAVATGGQAELIIDGSRYLSAADPDLTLHGLRLIWERNQKRQTANP
ncbi:MAG: type III pantothenate kinase [Acidobacteria bacterium]|nr:type III pantothenate kinase [Acidobacteriota bacterium]MBI3279206.1 type III pantothenate kinase [Acidobacteriota bacterium]